MKRKRINHHVDIFCEMFSGWRLVNDMDTLIQLKQGHFELNFIDKYVRLNDEPYDKEFHMFYEIIDWFERDLNENNINKNSLQKALLKVDFETKVIEGKPKSKTKKIIEIKLNMIGTVLTDEKEYSSMKEKTLEYHYIDKK